MSIVLQDKNAFIRHLAWLVEEEVARFMPEEVCVDYGKLLANITSKFERLLDATRVWYCEKCSFETILDSEAKEHSKIQGHILWKKEG